MAKKYDVGYGKPPKHTRFMKGQSGNSSGRPKGAKNLKTDLMEELFETIPLKESGKTKLVSKQRATLKALMMKAVHGDVRAITALISLALKLLPPPDEPETSDLSKSDEQILKEFMEREVGRALLKGKKR